LTVVIKRVLADRQAEDGPATPATGPDGRPSHRVFLDRDERRLGWFVAAIAITGVAVVLTVTLSRPSGLGGSADLSALPDAPAASWAGVPAAGDTGPAPAGSTPPGSVPTPAPGLPGGPAAAPATGAVAASPKAGATATPGGMAGPATTAAAATDGPRATTEPVPTTDPPPYVQATLADLSAEISRQVDAGQLDPTTGYDLQSKVHQVAREVSEGDWAAARYYAGRIRDKLRKYRDDGMLTSTGYQALIGRVDVLDNALA
jgi:hypothetical protein